MIKMRKILIMGILVFITIYDQLEIESAGLVSWANPRQCTYEKCYDSFARQFTTTLKVSLGEE